MKISFKDDLIDITKQGILYAFRSETLDRDELKEFIDIYGLDVQSEYFDDNDSTCEYFDLIDDNNDEWGCVYQVFKPQLFNGFQITLHILNDDYFQSENTTIYQIEKEGK